MSVEFAGDSPLSDEDKARFLRQLQANPLFAKVSEIDSPLYETETEVLRQSLTTHGYFHAVVTARPFLVRATPDTLEYALRIEIASGPQYRVGSVRIANADPDHPHLAVDSALLRQKIPLEVGDILDVSKLQEGLRAASRLYQERGYIDVTIEPDFDVREALSGRPSIDVLLNVDEQIPYRLGDVRILGLDLTTVEQLQSHLPQQTGDLFNPILWRDFFEQNKSRLPATSSADRNLQGSKDVKNASLDITLDFRQCAENLQRTNLADVEERQPPQ